MRRFVQVTRTSRGLRLSTESAQISFLDFTKRLTLAKGECAGYRRDAHAATAGAATTFPMSLSSPHSAGREPPIAELDCRPCLCRQWMVSRKWTRCPTPRLRARQKVRSTRWTDVVLVPPARVTRWLAVDARQQIRTWFAAVRIVTAAVF